MTNATRYAVQFADGSFAGNCSTKRRTHKTAALAQAYIASCIRAHSPKERAKLIRQGYSETSATHALEHNARVTEIWQGATVVPV
jgi:hypothetical protein